jgi:hypothetical protein
MFDECKYIIPSVVERLGEAAEEVGVRVGFYWEEDLSGVSREGTYWLGLTKVVRTR